MTLHLRTYLIKLLALPAILSGLFSPLAPVRAQTVTTTQIGNPIWKPLDFHLFSGPASSDPEFVQTLNTILTPPYYQPHPDILVGPGAPHAPPYDKDLADGIAHAGFQSKSVFSPVEFSGTPGGVFFVEVRAGSDVSRQKIVRLR
jgi:hypothetical protein